MTCSAETMPYDARTTGHSSTGGVLNVVQRWWEAYWSSRARSATMFVLRGLDDRTLHDIGIQRSEIESIAYASPSDRLRHFTAEQR